MSTPKPLFDPPLEAIPLEAIMGSMGIPAVMFNAEGNYATTLSYAKYEQHPNPKLLQAMMNLWERKLQEIIDRIDIDMNWEPAYLLPLGKKLYKRRNKPLVTITWDSEEQK